MIAALRVRIARPRIASIAGSQALRKSGSGESAVATTARLRRSPPTISGSAAIIAR